MSQKRIRVTPTGASVSFTELLPSRRRKRRKCTQQSKHIASHITQPKCDEAPSQSETQSPEIPAFVNTDVFGDVDLPPQASASHSRETRSYDQRQKKLSEAWSRIRKQLHDALIESSVFDLDASCANCGQTAAVICQQCGPQVLYCEECAEENHLTTNIFHRPQLMKVCFMLGTSLSFAFLLSSMKWNSQWDVLTYQIARLKNTARRIGMWG